MTNSKNTHLFQDGAHRKLCNKLATNRSAIDTHLLAKRNVIRGSIKDNNSTNKLPLLAHYNPGPNYWETLYIYRPYLMDLRLSILPVRYPNFNIEWRREGVKVIFVLILPVLWKH